MGRNRSKPGDIQFVCVDVHHHDGKEWAAYGCHLVGTLRLKRRQGGTGYLDWTGHLAESRDRIATSGITLTIPGIAPDLPVKGRRRDDGEQVWRFRCSCALDKQRAESELAQIIASYSKAFPGMPVKIDIARL
jgi:hypothetical protein